MLFFISAQENMAECREERLPPDINSTESERTEADSEQGSHSTWKTWKNEGTPGKPGNIMEFWKI